MLVNGGSNEWGRTLNESQLLLPIFKTNVVFFFFFMLALLVEHSLWSSSFLSTLAYISTSIFRLSIFTHYIIQFFKFLQILIDLCGQLSCAASNSLPCRDSNPGLPSMKQTAYQCATVIVLLDCINNLKDCLHNQKTL